MQYLLKRIEERDNEVSQLKDRLGQTEVRLEEAAGLKETAEQERRDLKQEN